MRKILTIVFSLFFVVVHTQNNSEAELLLNTVSSNIKNYDNIYINYTYTLNNI